MVLFFRVFCLLCLSSLFITAHWQQAAANVTEETAAIVPPDPDESETFKVELKGLDIDDSSGQGGQCYFYKIKELESGDFLHKEGGPEITCDENDIDDGNVGGDDPVWYSGHKEQLYATFVSTPEEDHEKTLDFSGGLPEGRYRFELWEPDGNGQDDQRASVEFDVGDPNYVIPSPYPPPCIEGNQHDFVNGRLERTATSDTSEIAECTRVRTAFGDLSVRPLEFVSSLMGLILGLSGGIAILLIIYSGYRFMTSQGNPEKVQEARDRLTSAIIGLLFIIFSLMILTIIGVDILRIPGFGG